MCEYLSDNAYFGLLPEQINDYCLLDYINLYFVIWQIMRGIIVMEIGISRPTYCPS